jgi:murein DD-endopeptidase MepM/ murein hydrolase activator NlpD
MMHEFDPRRPTLRLAPKVFTAIAGLAALGLGWKLTATDAPVQVVKAPLDASALAALQHAAFASAEAQPGFERPESIPVKVRPGETLEGAVLRTGIAPNDARQVVTALQGAIDTVNIKAGMAFEAAVAERRNGPNGQNGGLGPPDRPVAAHRPGLAVTVSRTFDGAMRLRELDEKVPTRPPSPTATSTARSTRASPSWAAPRGDHRRGGQAVLPQARLPARHPARRRLRLVFDRKVTESGRTIATGDLEYAELKGVKFYRFVRPDGGAEFFDEAGKNIKGFLLRTPVDGARITSTFGQRKHPVLGFTRAHQGVDFGAGTGTPILAAGDGVVLEARRWGGYGNWLRIRHTAGWDTGYGHISRYAAGIRPGVRVRQGQVVAYVGSTGLDRAAPALRGLAQWPAGQPDRRQGPARHHPGRRRAVALQDPAQPHRPDAGPGRRRGRGQGGAEAGLGEPGQGQGAVAATAALASRRRLGAV